MLNSNGVENHGNDWVIVFSEAVVPRQWKPLKGFANAKPTTTTNRDEIRIFKNWLDAFKLAKKIQGMQELNLDVEIRRIAHNGEKGFYYLNGD